MKMWPRRFKMKRQIPFTWCPQLPLKASLPSSLPSFFPSFLSPSLPSCLPAFINSFNSIYEAVWKVVQCGLGIGQKKGGKVWGQKERWRPNKVDPTLQVSFRLWPSLGATGSSCVDFKEGYDSFNFRNITWTAMRKHWKNIKEGKEASKNQEWETSEILNWGREDEEEGTVPANVKEVELAGFHAQCHVE